jgi:hypothetical protein
MAPIEKAADSKENQRRHNCLSSDHRKLKGCFITKQDMRWSRALSPPHGA